MRFLLLILTLSIILESCKKEIQQSEAPFLDNKYFPINIGSSISYQIMEVNIDELSSVNDTILYQIMEKIDTIIENTKSYKTYRLERYFRTDSTKNWNILNVWQIRKYANRIHKIEDNIEYIRLLTPVRSNQEWDGNSYNNYDSQEYKTLSTKNIVINYKNHNCITVIHQDKISLIDKIFSEEQYSENIGLTKKTLIDVELNIDPNLPWEEKITKGTIYYQNYIDSK